MSKLTSEAGEALERLTVKVNTFVPELPSDRLTSLMVRFGGGPATQLLVGELVLRGKGAAANRSALLLFVSVQPPFLRKSAVVLLGAGAGPAPSKQFAVVP